MLKSLEEALINEARLHLQRIGSASTAIEIKTLHARYDQTLTVLKMLPQIIYGKDKESREAYQERLTKKLSAMEVGEWSKEQ